MNAFSIVRAIAALLTSALTVPASAQWLDLEHNHLPKKADGSFNPDAPAPVLPDGKPDFSGVWSSRFMANAVTPSLENLDTDTTPYQPWARELTRKRVARNGLDDPASKCLPTGHLMFYDIPPIMKFFQQPDTIVMLYEPAVTYRQVFLDGRAFPEDPLPSYNGYSVGHWEGDILVIESIGYNGTIWIDSWGRPTTDKLRVTERWRRPTFGTIDLEITFDDPGAYTKPWSRKHQLVYKPTSELVEVYCEENAFIEQLEAVDKLEAEAGQ